LAKIGLNIMKAVLFSLTVIALYSCTSMGTIAIQVSFPSKHSISPNIQSIAILNRSITTDFFNSQNYSIEKRLIANKRFEMACFDSTASDTAITAAAKSLYNSQRFDVVVPLERNILRYDDESILEPLDSASVNQLCKTFKVDAILVLESFSEKVNGEIYPRERNNFNYLFTGVINLDYKLVWRLYQIRQEPSVRSYVVSDEIFWDSGSFNSTPKEAFDKLPTVKDALIGGGIAAGQDIADSISLKWVNETRNYYITRNEKIDAAIPLIKQNKWDEALEIWKNYSLEPSNSLRSKIEYNLALASEMCGDIDSAIEWAGKSLKSKYSRNAEDYLFNLSRRPINQNRYCYTTGIPEIDAAVSLIKLNKWDEAAGIWLKYLSVSDKILQCKIEYNLALTEEMRGNINLAVKWATESLKTNNSLNTKKYLLELKQISRSRRVVKYSNDRTSSDSDSNIIPWSSDGREE
jgi:tetratricopeptide (TPR) repeat protein